MIRSKRIQSKINFNHYSHKIEKTLTVEELKQHLKKTIPYAKVPVETLQAYNLVGNRHEKRAKIHKYAQQIGNTYANIMQKLNAKENISSYDLQNFANGINFLVENKQKITPNMITTLARGIDSLTQQNKNIEPNMINALARGIDSLTQQNKNINSVMITALEKATSNVANQIDSLLVNPSQNIEPNMINALAMGIEQNQNQNIAPSLLNTLARGIDSLTQQNKNIEPNMINALARGIEQNQNIDPILLNTLARGIVSLTQQNKNIEPNMINALARGIEQNQNIDPILLNTLARGIVSLTQQNKNIEPNMINALARGINSLTQQNQNIEPNMLNALARGIDSLTQQNKNIEPYMITILESSANNVANQIGYLLKNQNQNIEPNMLNALARGIDSLLLKKETKDFSYELKILSQGTLTLISNDYPIDNLENLYTTLQSLHTKINVNCTITKLPTITHAEGETYLDTLDQQSATYGKSKKGNGQGSKKLLRYKRNSGEICNFRLSYKSLSERFKARHKDNETQLQKQNKEISLKQNKDDAKIKLLKLKTPAMFKDDVSFDKIMQEYAYKEQEEVGVKNSDIRIVENDIVFFTHQYDKLKVLNQKPEDYELPGNPEIMVQKGSKVEIANNPTNIAKLNDLISILKPQCHENSYACLTHLVHRAIQRYGEINGSYDLDKTISSVKELLKLKDSILTKTNKLQIKNDELKLLKTVKLLQNEIEKSQPNIKKIKEKLENLVSLELLKETNFIETINELISKLSVTKTYDSFEQYAIENELISQVKKILKNGQSSDEKNNIIELDDKELLNKIMKYINEKKSGKNVDIPSFITGLAPNVKLTQINKKLNQFKNKITSALEEYNKSEEVKFTDELKQQINTFLDNFIKYQNQKVPKDRRFTLNHSIQGDKYNYKAYEIKTELGTLIVDNKGKISTIINTTIYN